MSENIDLQKIHRAEVVEDFDNVHRSGQETQAITKELCLSYNKNNDSSIVTLQNNATNRSTCIINTGHCDTIIDSNNYQNVTSLNTRNDILDTSLGNYSNVTKEAQKNNQNIKNGFEITNISSDELECIIDRRKEVKTNETRNIFDFSSNNVNIGKQKAHIFMQKEKYNSMIKNDSMNKSEDFNIMESDSNLENNLVIDENVNKKLSSQKYDSHVSPVSNVNEHLKSMFTLPNSSDKLESNDTPMAYINNNLTNPNVNPNKMTVKCLTTTIEVTESNKENSLVFERNTENEKLDEKSYAPNGKKPTTTSLTNETIGNINNLPFTQHSSLNNSCEIVANEEKLNPIKGAALSLKSNTNLELNQIIAEESNKINETRVTKTKQHWIQKIPTSNNCSEARFKMEQTMKTKEKHNELATENQPLEILCTEKIKHSNTLTSNANQFKNTFKKLDELFDQGERDFSKLNNNVKVKCRKSSNSSDDSSSCKKFQRLKNNDRIHIVKRQLQKRKHSYNHYSNSHSSGTYSDQIDFEQMKKKRKHFQSKRKKMTEKQCIKCLSCRKDAINEDHLFHDDYDNICSNKQCKVECGSQVDEHKMKINFLKSSVELHLHYIQTEYGEELGKKMRKMFNDYLNVPCEMVNENRIIKSYALCVKQIASCSSDLEMVTMCLKKAMSSYPFNDYLDLPAVDYSLKALQKRSLLLTCNDLYSISRIADPGTFDVTTFLEETESMSHLIIKQICFIACMSIIKRLGEFVTKKFKNKKVDSRENVNDEKKTQNLKQTENRLKSETPHINFDDTSSDISSSVLKTKSKEHRNNIINYNEEQSSSSFASLSETDDNLKHELHFNDSDSQSNKIYNNSNVAENSKTKADEFITFEN